MSGSSWQVYNAVSPEQSIFRVIYIAQTFDLILDKIYEVTDTYAHAYTHVQTTLTCIKGLQTCYGNTVNYMNWYDTPTEPIH